MVYGIVLTTLQILGPQFCPIATQVSQRRGIGKHADGLPVPGLRTNILYMYIYMYTNTLVVGYEIGSSTTWVIVLCYIPQIPIICRETVPNSTAVQFISCMVWYALMIQNHSFDNVVNHVNLHFHELCMNNSTIKCQVIPSGSPVLHSQRGP